MTEQETLIRLREAGFQGIDLLSRKTDADALIRLISSYNDPLVIAVDGPWGSGKSFLLSGLIGELKKSDETTFTTVFFDAFEHDYLEDPLVGLTVALQEQISRDKADSDTFESLKMSAAKLAMPLFRIGLAAASGGLTEIVGAVGDRIVDKTSSEIESAADSLWHRAAEKQNAVEAFRKSLQGLTECTTDSHPQKIVFVIDELDRCRPDYALSLIEVIKHFFTTPNVHFVLGANIPELQNIVKARYGNESNAERYLQKFVTLSYSLSRKARSHYRNQEVVLYYLARRGEKNNFPSRLIESLSITLERILLKSDVTLRDIDRILLHLSLVSGGKNRLDALSGLYRLLTISLVIAKVIKPSLYSKIRDRTVEFGELREFFHLPEKVDETSDSRGKILEQIWARVLFENSVDENYHSDVFRGLDIHDFREALGLVVEQLESFDNIEFV